jgi:hypothetical protein
LAGTTKNKPKIQENFELKNLKLELCCNNEFKAISVTSAWGQK